MVVYVHERFALNYPTLEGGFTADVENIDAFVEEMRGGYAYVAEPSFISTWGEWHMDVYENMEV